MLLSSSTACSRACMLETSTSEQTVCTQLRTMAFLQVISDCGVHAFYTECSKPHPAGDHVLANCKIPAITPGRWHGLAFICVVKESTHKFTLKSISNFAVSHWGHSIQRKRKRKGSAGSDDTASMIMRGGYWGARTRQPPSANNK